MTSRELTERTMGRAAPGGFSAGGVATLACGSVSSARVRSSPLARTSDFAATALGAGRSTCFESVGCLAVRAGWFPGFFAVGFDAAVFAACVALPLGVALSDAPGLPGGVRLVDGAALPDGALLAERVSVAGGAAWGFSRDFLSCGEGFAFVGPGFACSFVFADLVSRAAAPFEPLANAGQTKSR